VWILAHSTFFLTTPAQKTTLADVQERPPSYQSAISMSIKEDSIKGRNIADDGFFFFVKLVLFISVLY